MELVTPGIGLVFWMTLSFSILLFILTKFAWKPIMKMIREREQSIEAALLSAEKAKDEMAKLQANNEQLLKDAREERDSMIKEARAIKDQIIAEAKQLASVEAKALVEGAKETISLEKKAAINEIKNQVSSLSLEIAEKILKTTLADDAKQKELVAKLLDEIKLN